MVEITRGQANTIYVTATELVTLSSPVFLFRFTNEATGTVNTCIGTNTSSYTRRYDKFTITESTTEDRANGTLSLLYAGFWKYEIFEQSDSTLIVGSQSLVEEGICQVIDTAILTTWIQSGNGDTYVE